MDLFGLQMQSLFNQNIVLVIQLLGMEIIGLHLEAVVMAEQYIKV
jgi:hypothetical protein